ncbi:MAG: aminotransferase [Proteobacteria bacterium]|nr:MAG: aminotransferase [Pseudomonadota bacterium]PIE64549.1 MAG: aminotransferase [Desulfobacterales bacterium]
MNAIADRMKHIVPFYVMELLTRAKEIEATGRSVIHMEVGEPDFVTAAPIVQGGKAALDAGHTGYTPAAGIVQLREAIAGYYRTRFGIDIDPRRIVVTPGSSGALQLILSVLVNPGQEFILADPGYPCNKNFVELVSGVPVAVPVNLENNYQLNADLVAAHWSGRTRGVLVASPSNPTGTIISKPELEKVFQVVLKGGGNLVVDEIYQGLVYGVDNYTALDISDQIFVINSFSKYFGMTGWRLGWLVAPEAYVDSIDCLAQNIFLSSSAPAQYGAVEAFSPACLKILEERRQAFWQRRDFLLPALRGLGFEIPVVPDGAFYLYADCSRLTRDSFAFAYDLLEAEGVAITPGRDFGSNKPERYVRFAYTTGIEKMKEAVARIARYLETADR